MIFLKIAWIQQPHASHPDLTSIDLKYFYFQVGEHYSSREIANLMFEDKM